MWMSQTPPMLWSAKVGQTKPIKWTRDFLDVTDPEYLASLPRKTSAVLSGRVTCILSKTEKTIRQTKLQAEEADEVALLMTPRDAQKEQILEEALRQLQVKVANLLIDTPLQIMRSPPYLSNSSGPDPTN